MIIDDHNSQWYNGDDDNIDCDWSDGDDGGIALRPTTAHSP